MKNEKRKYRKILEKLEAAVTKYHNLNCDLIDEYVMYMDDPVKQKEISDKYDINIAETTKLNRRIALLKNQLPFKL